MTTSITLGEKLKQLREGANYSAREVARFLKIQERFVIWLEAGAYEKLPGDIYIKNWLREYLNLFKTDPRPFLELYKNERSENLSKKSNYFLAPSRKNKFFSLHLLGRLIFFVSCLIIIAYLGFRLTYLIAAPPLVLYEPLDHTVTKSTTIRIRGKTAKHTAIFINNQEVKVNKDGLFDESLEISYGLNEILIMASSKRGKRRIVRRTILVESSIQAKPTAWLCAMRDGQSDAQKAPDCPKPKIY